MIFKSIKRKLNLFLVNRIFVGTHYYEIKRRLLISIGYDIGNNTKIVGPIYNTAKLIIGNDCWVGKKLTINGNGTVIIEDNCDIAPEVTFLTGGHKIGNCERRAGIGEKYSILVKRGTWIGARSTLGKNIIIGKACVVGACACVLENVEDNCLVGGVPAKVIRKLND